MLLVVTQCFLCLQVAMQVAFGHAQADSCASHLIGLQSAHRQQLATRAELEAIHQSPHSKSRARPMTAHAGIQLAAFIQQLRMRGVLAGSPTASHRGLRALRNSNSLALQEQTAETAVWEAIEALWWDLIM